MKRFLPFLLTFIFVLVGCSGEQAAQHEEPKAVQSGPADMPEHKPEHPGVYVNHQNNFMEMFRGNNEDLQTTNADRGFGFLMPVGQHYSVDMRSWTIWSRRLNQTTLQITKLDGAVIMPENWFSEPKKENIAWLPTYSVPVRLKHYSGVDNMTLMTTDHALDPGFYVIHDDTFVRARRKDEVGAYYPFIVTTENNDELPWTIEAGQCYRALFDQYDKTLSAPTAETMITIKNCATLNHLSMRLNSSRDAVVNHQKQLLFLLGTTRELGLDAENQMYLFMNQDGLKIDKWFWKFAHFNVITKLSQIAKRLDANALGSNTPYDNLLPTIYNYFLGTVAPPQPGLESLAWIPFAAIENDELIEQYAAALHAKENWEIPLVNFLGALELKKFDQFIEHTGDNSSWKTLLEKNIPGEFRKLADAINVRHAVSDYLIGKPIFNNVQESEATELTQKVHSVTKNMEPCVQQLERKYGRHPAVLFLDQFLNLHIIGHDPESTLLNPFASTRRTTQPAFDAEFARCTKKVFTDIKLHPSLNETKKMILPIILSSQNDVAWKY